MKISIEDTISYQDEKALFRFLDNLGIKFEVEVEE